MLPPVASRPLTHRAPTGANGAAPVRPKITHKGDVPEAVTAEREWDGTLKDPPYRHR